MAFPQTENAIWEMFANSHHGFGVHDSGRIVSGGSGLVLGEVPYDAELHDPSAIKPFSIMEEITGEPQVDLVKTLRPLHINVITDYTGSNYYHPIAAAKRRGALMLSNALTDSLTSITDRLDTFTIGAQDREGLDLDAEELVGPTASAEDRAKAVADICDEGRLTFVVSDFSALPVEKQQTAFDMTVAIKLNHLLERKIPAKVGVIALTSGVEVNTNRPNRLTEVNQRLADDHRTIVSRLSEAGLTMVELIARADFTGGVSGKEADDALANAIQSIAQK